VSDAGDHLSKRRKFFRLQQLRLELTLVGDVLVSFEPANCVCVQIEHWAGYALQHSAGRNVDFQFVAGCARRAFQVSPPTIGKRLRVAKMGPQNYNQRLVVFDFAQRSEIESEKLSEFCIGESNAPRGAQQQDS